MSLSQKVWELKKLHALQPISCRMWNKICAKCFERNFSKNEYKYKLKMDKTIRNWTNIAGKIHF